MIELFGQLFDIRRNLVIVFSYGSFSAFRSRFFFLPSLSHSKKELHSNLTKWFIDSNKEIKEMR